MGRDKRRLAWGGGTLERSGLEQLRRVVDRVVLSLSPDQEPSPDLPLHVETVRDRYGEIGPAGGLITASDAVGGVAWLVLAVDMPGVTPAVLERLRQARDPTRAATLFGTGAVDDRSVPEPLCAIWEPAAVGCLRRQVSAGRYSLRATLGKVPVRFLDPGESGWAANLNTPLDYHGARRSLDPSVHPPTRSIEIEYYAILREQRGLRMERRETAATDAAGLYAELVAEYGFSLRVDQLKVAINDDFSTMETPLQAGDRVVFIPPVAGG